MSITILDNDYATLQYHPETKIVHHQFHKPISGDPFREVLTKGAEACEEYGAIKWISDDRANSAIPPEDGQWAENVWVPRVLAVGWKYWAIVMPAKIIGQMNMQYFKKQNEERGVTVQVFSDPTEAMTWLENQGD
jgi:hypothetical protein